MMNLIIIQMVNLIISQGKKVKWYIYYKNCCFSSGSINKRHTGNYFNIKPKWKHIAFDSTFLYLI